MSGEGERGHPLSCLDQPIDSGAQWGDRCLSHVAFPSTRVTLGKHLTAWLIDRRHQVNQMIKQVCGCQTNQHALYRKYTTWKFPEDGTGLEFTSFSCLHIPAERTATAQFMRRWPFFLEGFS